MSLMEKIFGDLNEKEVKKVSKIADKVMAYDEEYQKLTDQELRDKTQEFKKRIQEGETLDALLPEALCSMQRGRMAEPGNEALLRAGHRRDRTSSGQDLGDENR